MSIRKMPYDVRGKKFMLDKSRKQLLARNYLYCVIKT